jgi:hypothetical protein
MQLLMLFIVGSVVLAVLEERGRVRWRTTVVLAGCAIFAVAFTSYRLV